MSSIRVQGASKVREIQDDRSGEDLEPLVLAEMKVPGRAWLQYEVMPADGGSRLVQTAFFEPKGLPGLAYWYVLYPVHGLIFRGMVRVLAEHALRRGGGPPPTT